jgi:hypothetical protein
MPKKLAKMIFIVMILSLPLSLASLALAAQQAPPGACVEDYTVQAGDWISTIAEKYYGDVLAYTAIVNATNIAAAEAGKYLSISNPNLIEAGQVLCIPSVEEAQALLNGQQPEGRCLPWSLPRKCVLNWNPVSTGSPGIPQGAPPSAEPLRPSPVEWLSVGSCLKKIMRIPKSSGGDRAKMIQARLFWAN